LLDGLEQSLVDDHRLLAVKDLAPVLDFADEEPVAEEVRKRASAEWNAAARFDFA